MTDLSMFPTLLVQPMCDELNVITQAMARRLFPMGYDRDTDPAASVSPGDPRDLIKGGRLTVWTGASDHTIYGSPGINWDARAWHDWAHWRYNLPFTMEGETATAYVQLNHIAHHYGDMVDAASYLLTEIVGQGRHMLENGQFPADQRAFAETTMRPGFVQTAARRILNRLGDVGDLYAIALAKLDMSEGWI